MANPRVENLDDSFKLHMQFASLAELDARVSETSLKASFHYSRYRDKTIATSKVRRNINPQLELYNAHYTCVFSGDPTKSKGRNIRKRKSKKINCPAFFKLNVTKGGRFLRIYNIATTHNHQPSSSKDPNDVISTDQEAEEADGEADAEEQMCENNDSTDGQIPNAMDVTDNNFDRNFNIYEEIGEQNVESGSVDIAMRDETFNPSTPTKVIFNIQTAPILVQSIGQQPLPQTQQTEPKMKTKEVSSTLPDLAQILEKIFSNMETKSSIPPMVAGQQHETVQQPQQQQPQQHYTLPQQAPLHSEQYCQLQQVQQTAVEQQIETVSGNEQQVRLPEHHMTKSVTDYAEYNVDGGVSRRPNSDCQLPAENENSSHVVTSEDTLVESIDPILSAQQQVQQQIQQSQQQQQLQHQKLNQQNSAEKIADPQLGSVSTEGDQTNADLQQKLVQLTSQPSESLNVGTPPISHLATPHGHPTAAASSDTYMHSPQQKLINIGIPLSSGQSLRPENILAHKNTQLGRSPLTSPVSFANKTDEEKVRQILLWISGPEIVLAVHDDGYKLSIKDLARCNVQDLPDPIVDSCVDLELVKPYFNRTAFNKLTRLVKEKKTKKLFYV